MAFIQSDLDAINSAIASGELEVQFGGTGPGGRRVIYRSMQELLAAKSLIAAELRASGAIAAKPGTTYSVRTRT